MATAGRPGPILAYEEGTFACFTVRRRIPKILAEARAEVGGAAGRDRRWDDLEQTILSGGPIDAGLISTPTHFWKQTVERWRGSAWADLPFFDLEFLLYRTINSLADELRPGFDVFSSARRAALEEALPRVRVAVDSSEVDLLRALLWALAGNEADLSQLTGSRPMGNPAVIVVDARAPLVERLDAAKGHSVVVLADNAGSELCFDLVLIDQLLASGIGRVDLHVKPSPMFVSDALVSDVDETVAAFREEDAGRSLRQVGERLQAARQQGRLVVVAPPDWGEPRHMNALSPDLDAALGRAAVVVAKGDLNYRRFFEDRAWPETTFVSVASVAAGMCAFALRVLKSDCVVGVPKAEVSNLFRADSDWRSDGRYSLVQRVDTGG
jgi:uncharacterized protein with ATP-grasp and redox domains